MCYVTVLAQLLAQLSTHSFGAHRISLSCVWRVVLIVVLILSQDMNMFFKIYGGKYIAPYNSVVAETLETFGTLKTVKPSRDWVTKVLNDLIDGH